jgi:hypothetical protein
LLICLFGFGLGANTFALSGIDPTFDTSILSYDVEAEIVAVQPDGKILVLGKFDNVNGVKKTD